MTNKSTLTLALGTTLVAGLTFAAVQAADNPFSATKLDSGYQVAENKAGEMKCGAGMCGANMKKQKSEEGACGAKAEECPADTDKDGKVTKAEFTAHHDKLFTEYDADKDGALSADERKALRKHMMEGKCGGKEASCGAKSAAQTAPAQTAPAQTAPAQTAPAQTAPAQTAPAQTAPAQK